MSFSTFVKIGVVSVVSDVAAGLRDYFICLLIGIRMVVQGTVTIPQQNVHNGPHGRHPQRITPKLSEVKVDKSLVKKWLITIGIYFEFQKLLFFPFDDILLSDEAEQSKFSPSSIFTAKFLGWLVCSTLSVATESAASFVIEDDLFSITGLKRGCQDVTKYVPKLIFARIASFLFEICIEVVNHVALVGLGGIVTVFLCSLLIFFRIFQSRWVYMGYEPMRWAKWIDNNWCYCVSFGAPLAFIYCLCSGHAITRAIFTLLFFLSMMATCCVPEPTEQRHLPRPSKGTSSSPLLDEQSATEIRHS